MFGVWCLVFCDCCLVFGVCCLLFVVWCLVHGIWRLLFGVFFFGVCCFDSWGDGGLRSGVRSVGFGRVKGSEFGVWGLWLGLSGVGVQGSGDGFVRSQGATQWDSKEKSTGNLVETCRVNNMSLHQAIGNSRESRERNVSQ